MSVGEASESRKQSVRRGQVCNTEGVKGRNPRNGWVDVCDLLHNQLRVTSGDRPPSSHKWFRPEIMTNEHKRVSSKLGKLSCSCSYSSMYAPPPKNSPPPSSLLHPSINIGANGASVLLTYCA